MDFSEEMERITRAYVQAYVAGLDKGRTMNATGRTETAHAASTDIEEKSVSVAPDLHQAALHTVAMWEAHPETVMPSTLIAALAALREAIK